MKYPTVFHLIGIEFDKAKIPFVIVGGFAVNYHQFPRLTGDLDIIIKDEDYPKARSILNEAGYRKVVEGNLFARFVHEEVLLMDLDAIFVDGKTLLGILKDAKETEVQGIKLKVPSLEHLIALKLHSIKNNPEGRESIDLGDILELIRRNKIDVESLSFRDLCLKYGTQPMYGRILENQRKWKS